MKKVGIVTIYDEMNFGNRLQNYALQYILHNELGVKCTTLVSNTENLLLSMWKINFLSWLSYTPFSRFIKRNATDLRYYKFRRFTKKFIRTKVFWGYSQLPNDLADQFDLFIVGSDQVWNWELPVVRKYFDDFFLCFAEDNQKNSYAASFGLSSIKNDLKMVYKQKLQTFKSLSVRENSGERIIDELLGRDSQINLDPTLLLSSSEWERIEKKPCCVVGRPYILNYFLSNEYCKYKNKIDAFASSWGLDQYNLLDDNVPEYISGPSEFLYWIRHASVIFTDSFHATVFSIIFDRPFIVFARKSMNSRIDTLLKMLHLENHFFTGEKFSESIFTIDYKYAHKTIEQEKEVSMDYLKKIVS